MDLLWSDEHAGLQAVGGDDVAARAGMSDCLAVSDPSGLPDEDGKHRAALDRVLEAGATLITVRVVDVRGRLIEPVPPGPWIDFETRNTELERATAAGASADVLADLARRPVLSSPLDHRRVLFTHAPDIGPVFGPGGWPRREAGGWGALLDAARERAGGWPRCPWADADARDAALNDLFDLATTDPERDRDGLPIPAVHEAKAEIRRVVNGEWSALARYILETPYMAATAAEAEAPRPSDGPPGRIVFECGPPHAPAAADGQ